MLFNIKIINNNGFYSYHVLPVDSVIELNNIIGGLKKSKNISDVKILNII